MLGSEASALPRRVKAGYGAAEWGQAAMEVTFQLYLLAFYTQQVGLRPDLAGLALGIAVAWDAITDPAMGVLSDHTRSAWGKRRPYIMVGSIACALLLVLLFWPPAMASQFGKFLYLLLLYVAVNTAFTVVNVPHAAFAGELADDRHERTELFGWRLLFSNAGFLLGTILPGALTSLEDSSGEGMAHVRALAAMGIAVVIVVTGGITVWATRGRDAPAASLPPGGILRQLRGVPAQLFSALRNKVFLPLLLGFVLAQAGRTLNASLAIYYYTGYLRLSEGQMAVAVLGLFILVVTLSIPAWLAIAKKFGKKWPAFCGAFGLGLFSVIAYPLFPPEILWPPMVFAAGLGGFLSGSIILLQSLVADIVDYDELKTGQHREGLYFGCWTMATKLSRAIGLALSGQMLQLIGLDPGGATISGDVAWRIALLFGPGVGISFMAGAAVFAFMPLTDQQHQRIQQMLQRRRGSANSG